MPKVAKKRAAVESQIDRTRKVSLDEACVLVKKVASAKFDEAKIKDLTGGDVISCRRMSEDWWEYKPTHTLFLAADGTVWASGRNHLGQLGDGTFDDRQSSKKVLGLSGILDAEQVWRGAMVTWGRDPDAAAPRKDKDAAQPEENDLEQPHDENQ